MDRTPDDRLPTHGPPTHASGLGNGSVATTAYQRLSGPIAGNGAASSHAKAAGRLGETNGRVASPVVVDGTDLTIEQVCRVAAAAGEATASSVRVDDELPARMAPSVQMVRQAVDDEAVIYGVTTGFGGMVGVPISRDESTPLQTNLLAFLAAGAGDEIDRRHTRAAMLLRGNVLARGCSGIRPEFVQRMVAFLQADATPVVRQLGSIGASGDLVPLSTIGRSISGQAGRARVRFASGVHPAGDVLDRLGLEPLPLQPKEGLALVNGTSFSSAIAAGCVYESRRLMAVALGCQGLLLRSLLAQEEPFERFVHQQKPHPGQVWVAREIASLLADGRRQTDADARFAQDRYSIRCLPQYLGPLVETLARVGRTVETEMNAVSDNPLIDTADDRFYQSGNFLGQYIAIAMDDLRRVLGLTAKHLDVQIASVVAPEFSGGLPPSLRGNEAKSYNMGLKGLQITGNSIVPMLTHAANPLTEHYPTHAEQFNQNINGLSWGSASLAWESARLMRHYLAVSLLFGVQAVDLQARASLGHCDGRGLLGDRLVPLYEAVVRTIGKRCGESQPLIHDDLDDWLEEHLESLSDNIASHGSVVTAMGATLDGLVFSDL